MRIVRYSFLAAAAALAALPASASVVFVDAALASGANDGSSWADAFRGRQGLMAALAVATSGDEVWVADGTYAPAAAGGSRDLSHTVPSGVRVLGGFAGGEMNADQRDPAVNIAILTGDLDSNDGPPQNGFPMNAQENSRNVVRLVDAAPTTMIDGFTIRSGNATGTFSDQRNGGNVWIAGGGPALRRCVIENGYASRVGGGVFVLASAATFEECVLRGCRADTWGSGVGVVNDAVASFADCLFDANYCGTGAGAYVGTQLFNEPEATPGEAHFVRCEFRGAMGVISSPSGGGIYSSRGVVRASECRFYDNEVVGGGGALYLRASDAVFDRCDFVGNSAPGDGGGAIFIDGGGLTLGAGPSPVVSNSRFTGNNGVLAANFGGEVRFVNCTVWSNGFGFGFLTWPPLFCSDDSVVTLDNTIVYGNNTGGIFGSEGDALAGSGAYVVSRCVVQNWGASDVGDAFDADPLFMDAAGPDGVTGTVDDDVRLRAVSPALDVGDGALVPRDAMVDLAGAARQLDGDGVGGAVVDLGAYEKPCAPDVVVDGVVNFADLNALLGLFGLAAPGDAADIDGDGAVGFSDLNLLLSAFGNGC